MVIQNVRRVRLAQLIANKYGTQAKFIEATGENQGEVSALLKNKSFGEKKARSIEEKCGLEPGWLDIDESSPYDQRTLDRESRLLTLFRQMDDQGQEAMLQLAEVLRKK